METLDYIKQDITRHNRIISPAQEKMYVQKVKSALNIIEEEFQDNTFKFCYLKALRDKDKNKYDIVEQGLKARNEMMLAHRPFAVFKATQFLHQKEKTTGYADVVQEAFTGLLRAVELFDPERGYSFTTYADNWIRQKITSWFYRSFRLDNAPSELITLKTRYLKLKAEALRFCDNKKDIDSYIMSRLFKTYSSHSKYKKLGIKERELKLRKAIKQALNLPIFYPLGNVVKDSSRPHKTEELSREEIVSYIEISYEIADLNLNQRLNHIDLVILNDVLMDFYNKQIIDYSQNKLLEEYISYKEH